VQTSLLLLAKPCTDANRVPLFQSQFLKLTLQAESFKVCILHLGVIFVCFLFQVL